MRYKKTQKKIVESCVKYSQPYASFDGLKEGFEERLKSCEISQEQEKNLNPYGKNIERVCFSTLAKISQLMKLREKDLDSLVEVDHNCELTSQLLTTVKEKLEAEDEPTAKVKNNNVRTGKFFGEHIGDNDKVPISEIIKRAEFTGRTNT